MLVPVFHGLSPFDLARPARREKPCFPFDAPRRQYFYRARNAIYYLFLALRATRERLIVLMPDYNSGNEVLAVRAAGATVRYCPVGPDMLLDPREVERLCDISQPDVLYVIHYAGWPQPMRELVDVCSRRNILLVEDCALALFSEMDGQPLGSFGDWSVFCLYKTLPLPNGALLVHNTTPPAPMQLLRLRKPSVASVCGRIAELMVHSARNRAPTLGSMLRLAKHAIGRLATACSIHRATVGDIGFSLDDVDLAMSGVSARLLARLDLAGIRRRRFENLRRLSDLLGSSVTRVLPSPAEGVCPLFFPILVADKRAAAARLEAAGVEAIQFWNDSAEHRGMEMSPTARFLREHVLELPVHQDLTPRQVSFMADAVARLNLEMSGKTRQIHAA
jgi:dTDP-4-amino-4,6-dideoxygalactose transaminase